MKIVFDHQTFYVQNHGGISRYICELSSRLATYADFDISVIAPFHNNKHLSATAPKLLRTCSLPFQLRGSYRMECIAKGLLLPLFYNLHSNADIIHETYYSLAAYGSARARVVTVHDMIHELYPESFSDDDLAISHAKRAAIDRADHVICVSESTRNDLIRLLNVNVSKISVVHHGYSLSSVGTEIVPANLAFGRPYILFVGSRNRYKNFSRLCQAFSTSYLLKNDFDLVAFGGGKFTEIEINNLSELGICGNVHQISGDDKLLAQYYSGATLFVYPSLYEGFGIPPLEAMSFGCPVVCSNTSSIPEVVGNAGTYFDPADVDAIRDVIENIIKDDSQKAQMIELGYKQLLKYSWDKCASETAAIYRKLF